MKQVLFLFGLILSTSAQAAESTTKIQQGNWEASAGTKLNSGLQSLKRGSFNLAGSLQHFIWDGFSSGVEVNYFNYHGFYKGGVIAPVITKYLFAGERLAPYVSLLPVRFTKAGGGKVTYSSSARAGFKFFATEKLAIGPALDYTKGWSGDAFRGFSLMGTVSYHF